MLKSKISRIRNINLENKIVFLRADLNVSLYGLEKENPLRLTAIQPTLDLLLRNRSRVFMATHIGRPKNTDASLSTQHLIPWFIRHGYTIAYADTPETAYRMLEQNDAPLVLLENLRFWPEEKNGDIFFAERLKGQASIYVNDAFGTLHREDTSITTLPVLFAHDKKTIGLLVEKELSMLQPLVDNPAKPYMAFLGGGKVADKLPLIAGMLNYLSTLMLCPALVFTFLKALGKPVGRSLVEDDQLELARNLLREAAEKNVGILFPVDYIVAKGTFDGALRTVRAEDIEPDDIGIATGPATLELIKPYLAKAQTIFFNAAMGSLEHPQTVTELGRLLEQIVQCSAYTVIGGGDSVAAAQFFEIAGRASFCSTGGGATLHFISGNPLPGLQALEA